MSIEDDRDRYFKEWEIALYEGDDTGNYVGCENSARLLLSTLDRDSHIRKKLQDYYNNGIDSRNTKFTQISEDYRHTKKLGMKGGHRLKLHETESKIFYDIFDFFKQEFRNNNLLASRSETQIMQEEGKSY